jgi:hypothetical protein
MLQAHLSEVEHLSHRLRVDPYRADLLVERLLIRATNRDLDGAKSDLVALQQLGAIHLFTPTLARVASGELRVMEDAKVFLVFDPNVEAAWVGWTAQFLRDARAAADRFFGSLERVLLVELSAHRSAFQCALNEIPGVAYFKLAPRASLVEHEAIISHELAHVYLASGNRFLDEGIASFFQAQAHRGRILVESELVSASSIDETQEELLPLRALLGYEARMDASFERLVLYSKDKYLVYAAGYVLTAHLLNRLGMAGLKALCATLRTCPSPAAHPALVERVLSIGVEALDRTLYRKSSPPKASYIGLVGGTAPSAKILWTDFAPNELVALLTVLRDTLARDACSVGAKAVLARALIRRMLDMRAGRCAAEFAEARSLVHDLSVDFHFPEKDRLLLEGWLAIAQTHAAISTPVRIVSWEKALGIFRRALSRYGEDPEVLCASAILHLRGPVEHGANRALARTCLESVRKIEGWSALADAIERAHDTPLNYRSPPS